MMVKYQVQTTQLWPLSYTAYSATMLHVNYATCQLCYMAKQCHSRYPLMKTWDVQMAYSASCQQYWQMTLTTKWDFADSARHHFRSASSLCPSVPQPQNDSKYPSVLIHEADPRPLHESPKWSPNCITRRSCRRFVPRGRVRSLASVAYRSSIVRPYGPLIRSIMS